MTTVSVFILLKKTYFNTILTSQNDHGKETFSSFIIYQQLTLDHDRALSISPKYNGSCTDFTCGE